MAGMKSSQTNKSIAIVVAIVFVASAFLLFRSTPEEVVGVSADGLVRVSGLTRSSETLVIERIEDVETIKSPISPVYQISLSENGSLSDGELEMMIDQGESISDLVVYTFDRQNLSWIALPTLFDLTEKTISASLNFSGSLMVVAGVHE